MFKLFFTFIIFFQISEERKSIIADVVSKTEKAVVSVTCFQTRYYTEAPAFLFEDPFFREFFDFFSFPRYKEKIASQGSGFIISEDGYILTNEHVIQNADSIVVTLPDGRTFRAELIGKDFALDVALLKINGSNLPSLSLGDSEKLKRGEWVIALGNPFGFLWEDNQPTVTVGVISALKRSFKGEKNRAYRGFIQTDAAINPGNSGGPLINSEGKVIGMNTFIVSKSGGFEGIGFAIPINYIKKILPYLKEQGYFPRGFLGIEVEPYKGKGVRIKSVLKNSPADKGGLEPGDIILKMGKSIIKGISDYKTFVNLLSPGQKIRIFFKKGKKKELVDIVPVSRLKGFLLKMGIDLEEREGKIFINNIKRGRDAYRIGLKKEDIILFCEDIKLKNLKDLNRALSSYANKEKKFVILRGRFRYEFIYKEMD